MSRSGRVSRLIIAPGVLLLMITSCSSTDGSAPRAPATSGTSSSKAGSFAVSAPTSVARPTAQGNGVNRPQPAPPLPEGYVEDEFFISGTATSFELTETPKNGEWAAKPGPTAPYRTRVIVRRPAAERFSGTVAVEWFNVSAIEAGPDWAYLSREIAREGDVYVGVSTQSQGINGGDTLLDVSVNPETAKQAGVNAAVNNGGLRSIDPARYGSLEHPGDAYAFDIFSQVGKAIASGQGGLLDGLKPAAVVAVGESQSAAFLTTYVNAVHPLDPTYAGFLIHSRGANAAPIDGNLKRPTNATQMADVAVQIRTDLDVPVFIFETETDLTLLGYAAARQPDTDHIRTWEVAGTAHADYYQIVSVIGGSRDPNIGSFLGCTVPINVGPQHEVLAAAFHHFVRWVRSGTPPAPGRPISTTKQGDGVTIERDANQFAVGGVRNPLVDVPVVATIGDPPGGASVADVTASKTGVCLIFGQTIPFDQAKLLGLHGSADNYVRAFRASADGAVEAGHLLRPDADLLIAEAEQNRKLFP